MKWMMIFRRHPDFAWLTAGQIVSQVGDQIGAVTVLTLVYQWTGSTTVVGGLLMAQMLPILVLSPLAGPLIDRKNRRSLMVAVDAVRGLLTLGLFLVQTPWQLAVVIAVRSACGTLYNPARDALLPTLADAEELPEVVAVTHSCQQAARMVGPVVAGVLIAVAGLHWGIAVDAVSFLLSACLLLPIRRGDAPAAAGAAGDGYWKDVRSGLAFLFRHPILRPFIGAKGVALVGAGAVNALLVAFVSGTGLGMGGFGLLLSVLGAGSVAGSIAAVPAAKRFSVWSLISGGAAFMGLFLLLATHMQAVPVLLGAFGLIGLGMGALNFGLFTLVQRLTPDTHKGRTFAVTSSLDTAALIGAMGVAGIAADRIGIASTYTLAAICLLSAACWMLLLSRLEGAVAEPVSVAHH